MKKNNIFIIDGSSYIFRAFFAIPHLSNTNGLPTNAVYGVLKMLKNTILVHQPSHIVIALDSREKKLSQGDFPRIQ